MKMEPTNPDREGVGFYVYFTGKSVYTCLVSGCGNSVTAVISCAYHSYSRTPAKYHYPCTVLVCDVHLSSHLRGVKMKFDKTTSGCFVDTEYNTLTATERREFIVVHLQDVHDG